MGCWCKCVTIIRSFCSVMNWNVRRHSEFAHTHYRQITYRHLLAFFTRDEDELEQVATEYNHVRPGELCRKCRWIMLWLLDKENTKPVRSDQGIRQLAKNLLEGISSQFIRRENRRIPPFIKPTPELSEMKTDLTDPIFPWKNKSIKCQIKVVPNKPILVYLTTS